MLIENSKRVLEMIQSGNVKTDAPWMCFQCKTEGKGNYCPNCGGKRPPLLNIKCTSCGWVPQDERKTGKFCPDCGKAITMEDVTIPNLK